MEAETGGPGARLERVGQWARISTGEVDEGDGEGREERGQGRGRGAHVAAIRTPQVTLGREVRALVHVVETERPSVAWLRQRCVSFRQRTASAPADSGPDLGSESSQGRSGPRSLQRAPPVW